jgi:hypothetical protein
MTLQILIEGCIHMSQTDPSGFKSTKHKNSNPTFLDKFEQFCRIVHQYLRWFIQLIAVLGCFAFMNAEIAWKASLCILSVGNVSAIGALVEKWKGHP